MGGIAYVTDKIEAERDEARKKVEELQWRIDSVRNTVMINRGQSAEVLAAGVLTCLDIAYSARYWKGPGA